MTNDEISAIAENSRAAADRLSRAFDRFNAIAWRMILDENFGATDPRLPELGRPKAKYNYGDPHI